MINEDANEDILYEDTYGGEMSDNQDPDQGTQENEEVYHVNINDEPVHQMSSSMHNHIKVLQRLIQFKFLVQESNKEAKQDEEELHKYHQ
ncbi:hypothetical protein Bca52824_022915 [Brassica carinata]|uniref:Uncharacterized protein n=1 Tax=Brassica carinata TaxID=52824 RepID=A0A8X7VGV0_BRACI|nr:hypothetical protein Bca52824_022915 [Brassica carinata]